MQKKPRNRGLVHAWTSQKAAVSCSDRVVEMTGPHSRPVAEVPVHESPPAHRAHSSYSWRRTRLPPTPVGNYLFTARSPRCFVGQMKQKVPCSHHALVGPKGHLWNVFIMQLFHLPEDLSSVKCVKPTGQVISLHLLRLPNPLQLLMVWSRPSPLGDPPVFVDGKSCHDNSPNDTRQHW